MKELKGLKKLKKLRELKEPMEPKEFNKITEPNKPTEPNKLTNLSSPKKLIRLLLPVMPAPASDFTPAPASAIALVFAPVLALVPVITIILTLALTLLLPVSSFAQTGVYPNIAPKKPPVHKTAPSVKVGKRALPVNGTAISSLKGIVFLPSSKAFNKSGVSFTGVSVKGLPFLNTPFFISNMHKRLGHPLTFKDINDIVSLVDNIYKAHNLPFVDVLVPPQNVSKGTIQVVVTEFKVSSVNLSGNKHFTKAFILKNLSVPLDKPLSSAALSEDLYWVNKNPFLRVNALASPGNTPGSMNLNLIAKDVFPLSAYLGMDNQGVPSLGMNEWNLGFTWGNVFNTGQLFSFGYSQSFNARYRAYSASYDYPFPWKGSLNISGYYATAVPKIASSFSETGRNKDLSLSYKQELPFYITPVLRIRQSLGIGYDFKTTNNNLAFGGLQVFNGNAEVDQFPIFYSLNERDPYGTFSINNRFVVSPGGFNANNSDNAFSAIVIGAKSKYIYDDLNLSRIQRLNDNFSFHSSLNMQFADTNLLYTEQLASGGLYTAPGYAPDTSTGSRGIMLKEELFLPPLVLQNAFKARLGGFIDYSDLSQVENISAYTGLPNTQVLESIGPDLRMNLARRLFIRFDLGWRLRHIPYGSYGKGLFEDVEITGVF